MLKRRNVTEFGKQVCYCIGEATDFQLVEMKTLPEFMLGLDHEHATVRIETDNQHS